jgi:hypothetical protein
VKKFFFLPLLFPAMIILLCSACCNDTSQCPSDSYCEKTIGACNSIGMCVDKPQFCPDLATPEYVCGCDGNTYISQCDAALAGVNLLSEGECPCIENSDCIFDKYCQKDLGDCDGGGVCSEKPDFCTLIVDPVCGCDGQTYTNECFAKQSGINVASQGEC